MTTATVEFWLGALYPEGYELVLSPEGVGDDVDLSTVVSAVIQVRPPKGAEATWDTAISYDSNTHELTVTHLFNHTTSELAVDGWWRAYAILTLASGGGVLRSRPRSFFVHPKFEPGPCP